MTIPANIDNLKGAIEAFTKPNNITERIDGILQHLAGKVLYICIVWQLQWYYEVYSILLSIVGMKIMILIFLILTSTSDPILQRRQILSRLKDGQLNTQHQVFRTLKTLDIIARCQTYIVLI